MNISLTNWANSQKETSFEDLYNYDNLNCIAIHFTNETKDSIANMVDWVVPVYKIKIFNDVELYINCDVSPTDRCDFLIDRKNKLFLFRDNYELNYYSCKENDNVKIFRDNNYKIHSFEYTYNRCENVFIKYLYEKMNTEFINQRNGFTKETIRKAYNFNLKELKLALQSIYINKDIADIYEVVKNVNNLISNEKRLLDLSMYYYFEDISNLYLACINKQVVIDKANQIFNVIKSELETKKFSSIGCHYLRMFIYINEIKKFISNINNGNDNKTIKMKEVIDMIKKHISSSKLYGIKYHIEGIDANTRKPSVIDTEEMLGTVFTKRDEYSIERKNVKIKLEDVTKITSGNKLIYEEK